MADGYDIDPKVPPSGPGCVECLGHAAAGGSTCAAAPTAATSAAATRRRHSTPAATPRPQGHAVVQSYEPGEDWFWDYAEGGVLRRSPPGAAAHHPLDQPGPGPAGRVPDDWEQRLN